MADVAPDRTRLGGVGAVSTAIAFTGMAGVPGAIAAVAVFFAWALAADIVAFALAVVAAGALLSADAFVVPSPELVADVPSLDRLATVTGVGSVELLSIAVLAVALVPLLVGPLTGADRPFVVGLLAIVLTAVLATVAATPLLAGESVLVGAAVLGAVVAFVSYTLHRYGLLVAGVLQRG